jgi:hypothetical protein
MDVEDKGSFIIQHVGVPHRCVHCGYEWAHVDIGTITGGEGPSREHTVTETPRPVPISLPVPEYKAGETDTTQSDEDNDEFDGLPLHMIRPADEGRVYGARMPETSAVEQAAERADSLVALWQRTYDLVGFLAQELSTVAERVTTGDADRDTRLAEASLALAGTVIDLHKVRLQMQRFRPMRDVDVVAALRDLTVSVSRLRMAVIKDEAKPASYLVDGLEPHEFVPSGDADNGCTFVASGPMFPDGRRVCGYAANAQIHRRMLRMGKNDAPAPADVPSTRDTDPLHRGTTAARPTPDHYDVRRQLAGAERVVDLARATVDEIVKTYRNVQVGTALREAVADYDAQYPGRDAR